jgi:hypothetical protein
MVGSAAPEILLGEGLGHLQVERIVGVQHARASVARHRPIANTAAVPSTVQTPSESIVAGLPTIRVAYS